MILRDVNGRFAKGSVPEHGFKKGHVPSHKGKKRSPETIQKMRENCGHPVDEKTRDKISVSLKENFKNGEHPHNWNGGKYINQSGYVLVHIGNGNYVPEHRLIIEKEIGRKLKIDEHVHHINGIKNDNRLENLVIVINKQHFGEVTCPYCQKKILLK